jgi:hypothetical protein
MRNHRTWLAAYFLLGLVLVTGSLRAQNRGDTGTIRGAVVEATPDYLLVQPRGDAPRRIYYKTASARDLQIKAGDSVEVAWSYDDRRAVESVQRFAAPAPATAPAQAAPPVGNRDYNNAIGSAVNAILDDMRATAERLLDMPAYFVVGLTGIFIIAGALMLRRLKLMQRRPRLAMGLRIGLVGLSVVAVVYLIDQKIMRLQDELLELRLRLNSGVAVVATHASPSLNATSKTESRQAYLFDLTQAQRMLEAQFGHVELKPMICDEATDFIQIQLNNPLVHAGLAVIDLKNPKLKVKIGADFNDKTLTSAFARENQCSVAINGEAGATPSPNSGLGTWRGHMVQDGKVLLVEDSRIQRPFLAFDASNGVKFISAGAGERAVPADARNVIWGRWDVIQGGAVSPTAMRDRQPRTAMAINREGTRLYLLVVDAPSLQC